MRCQALGPLDWKSPPSVRILRSNFERRRKGEEKERNVIRCPVLNEESHYRVPPLSLLLLSLSSSSSDGTSLQSAGRSV